MRPVAREYPHLAERDAEMKGEQFPDARVRVIMRGRLAYGHSERPIAGLFDPLFSASGGNRHFYIHTLFNGKYA